MTADSPLLSLAPAPGTRLGDRYLVEAEIGEGGMGVVIAAFDERLGRRVAIKLLDPKRSASPLKRQRFLREARAVAMLESEHVVRVYDAGVFDDAGAYLAMERLEGTDLRKALAERERFSPEEAVEILVQACRAVATAHAGGIIHRDLKPANLFLVRSAEGTRVKVLDFGISKFTSEEDTQSSLTDTGSALGSPRYMSPEQVRDAKRVGPASDIWALGVILYELLAGRTPFVADTAPGVYAQIIADRPRPLRDIRPDIPPALEAICMRCLQKRPEDRYRDVATLAQALANGDGPIETEAKASEMTLDPLDAEPAPPAFVRKRYIVLGAVAAAALALVALTPFVASSRTLADAPVAALATSSPVTEVPPSVVLEPTPSARAVESVRSAAPAPPRPPAPPLLVRSSESATPIAPCNPPFIIDPATGTRRVKPGC